MTSSGETADGGGVALDELSASGLLAQAVEVEAMLREAAVQQLRIAYEWAITHPVVTGRTSLLEAPETLGGAGTPTVAAFTAEPLAVACGIAPSAATALLADSLDLHHRLPILWESTRAGMVAAWKARRVAVRTRHLSVEAAQWVDRHVAGRVCAMGAAQLDRVIAEAAARVDGESLADRQAYARAGWDVKLQHRDPARGGATSELHAVGDTLDLKRFHDVVCAEAETLGALGDGDSFEVRKAKALGVIADAQARLDLVSLLGTDQTPGEAAATRRRIIDRRDARVRLHLHASLADLAADTGSTDTRVGTVEGLGPVTLATIRDWVAKARVSVVPVLHVASEDTWSVDRHDPPPRMAEQVRLRETTCVFPWCGRSSRSSDLDHITPYADPDEGGPPGQTTPANLAPLCRRHHRAKTSGRWSYERTDPGTYLWTGPGGLSSLVTPTGTLAIPLS